MNRRGYTLAFIMNCLLGGLLLLSFGSGWYASLTGLTEFGLHRWASIVLVVGITVHVALHYKSLKRRRRRR